MLTKTHKPALPSPCGTWLQVNGVSVWVHENTDVHWALQFDDLHVSESVETKKSTHEKLQLAYCNPLGQVTARGQTGCRFVHSEEFLKALQDALDPSATFATLQSLPPAYVAVVSQGRLIQCGGQVVSYTQKPTLHHLSIPKRFVAAFKQSGIKNQTGQSPLLFNRVFQAVDQGACQSGSAVILIPAKSKPSVQQEAMLHLFAAYLEIEFIMPHLRALCGAYGGRARYLPQLNALVLQSYGDPNPGESLVLLSDWYDQVSTQTLTIEDFSMAYNQACSLLQLRGKPSLWYQLGEIVTTERWKITQAIWKSMPNIQEIDLNTLLQNADTAKVLQIPDREIHQNLVERD